MSLVGLVKVQENRLKEDTWKSLQLIQFNIPTQIRNVVIKPNLCYYWDYSTGQTTDPNFVAAIIDLVREKISKNAEISIVESDASAMKCKYAFKFLGYEKIAKNYGVKLVNLSDDESEKVEVSVRNERFEFMLPKTIKNADLRINVPKIKYLNYTKISCALKNIFGCNPEPHKFKYHPKIDETIVALNKIMKFNLHILDGLIVTGTRTTKLGLIMASQDPVALDAAAAEIAGINPKMVPHIRLASQERLGNIAYISRGEDPKIFAKIFPRRRLKDNLLTFAYKIAIKTRLLDTEPL